MERSSVGPFELFAIALLGTCLAVSASALVVAGFAGLLFGDGSAGGALADMPGVLAGLADHLGDPRRAWPAREAARLHGPFGFYATGLLVIAAASYGVVLGLRIKQRFAKHDAARWARPS